MGSASEVPDPGPAIDRPFAFAKLALTIFYLAGPLLIAAELLKPTFSILIVGLFALWSWTFSSSDLLSLRANKDFQANHSHGGRFGVAVKKAMTSMPVLGLCFVWLYLSGVGGFSYCHKDYVKHNMIFSYLMEQSLPIQDVLRGQSVIVHYSFAYYIVPVRLRELFLPFITIDLDTYLLVIYTSALFLAIVILAKLFRIRAFGLGIVMAIAGGFDVLGKLVIGTKKIFDRFNFEFWGEFYVQNLTSAFYAAPQQFFGALLGTTLLYAFLNSRESLTVVLADIGIIIAASAFWSPYVAFGLGVLALVSLATGACTLDRDPTSSPLSLRAFSAYALAGVLSLFALLFYAAAVPLSAPRLLLSSSNLVDWVITYVFNYAPFILALILAIGPNAWTDAARQSSEQFGSPNALVRRLAAGLVASAALLLLAHGPHGDWALKTTMPLSIMLVVTFAQLISSESLQRWRRVSLLGVLVLSSVSSLTEFQRQIVLKPNCAPYGTYRLEDMKRLAFQYLGRRDSILYSYFVRWR